MMKNSTIKKATQEQKVNKGFKKKHSFANCCLSIFDFDILK